MLGRRRLRAHALPPTPEEEVGLLRLLDYAELCTHTLRVGRVLAARLDEVRAARAREIPGFTALLGGPANREALAAFRERRPADFTRLEDQDGSGG